MSQLLDIDTAVDAISHAFDPLRCVVEVYDYKARKIRYQVFGHGKTAVATVSGVQVRDVLNPAGFLAEIRETRARLEHQGFVLKASNPLP